MRSKKKTKHTGCEAKSGTFIAYLKPCESQRVSTPFLEPDMYAKVPLETFARRLMSGSNKGDVLPFRVSRYGVNRIATTTSHGVSG